MVDLTLDLTLWQTYLLAPLLFGFAPGLFLRIIVLIYPRGHPRRKELIAELYTLSWPVRLLFVAQQLETALFEGLPCRLESRRKLGVLGRLMAAPLWVAVPAGLAFASPLWWPVAAVLLALLCVEYSDDIRALWYGVPLDVIPALSARGIRMRNGALYRRNTILIPWGEIKAIELSPSPVSHKPKRCACVGIRRTDGSEYRWILTRHPDRTQLERAVRSFAPETIVVVEGAEGGTQ